MSTNLTRRELLAGCVGTALAEAAAARDTPASRPGRDVSFLVLGDTHFDHLDHHDLDWLAKTHPGDVAQVRHYSRHAADLLPALLDAVRQQVRKARSEVACVAHIGDLVEGLCGTPRLARRQCEEALALLDRAGLSAPFLLTKGNHDVTGPGADAAYRDILLPYLGKQVGRELSAARYAVERHGCLFVLYDGYDKTSLAWLEQTLEAHQARPVFVIVHQPVVPFQARANWSLLIRPNQAAERARLLNLLGRHRAVVLVGHVHRYGAVVRETERGKFVQLALCSILSAKDQEPKEFLEGEACYGPDLINLEPRFQPDSRAERRQLLEAERPFIRRFEYANTAGYAVLRVENGKVRAEVYNGTGQRPWRSLPLSDWLA